MMTSSAVSNAWELRKVWKHEALNFTTWLAENIDVLNDATGLQLVGVEREKSAGSFNVDIVGETDGGRVVVENQLEKSDHDHLGKLLTYLVVMDATRAIWIVADPRPEHVAVVTWLNESASADFHLLKLEAIQIGDSAPAALLTQIVGPSEALKAVGTEKKQLVERQRLRYQFFEGLLNYARQETKLHANISPSTYNWVATGAGIAGVTYNYWGITKKGVHNMSSLTYCHTARPVHRKTVCDCASDAARKEMFRFAMVLRRPVFVRLFGPLPYLV